MDEGPSQPQSVLAWMSHEKNEQLSPNEVLHQRGHATVLTKDSSKMQYKLESFEFFSIIAKILF